MPDRPDYELKVAEGFGRRGQFPACFAFSVHKAGSTLMHQMIALVCRHASIPVADLPHIMFNEGLRDHDWNTDLELLRFFEDGRVYTGFRSMPPFLAQSELLRTRPVVLLVRDPRDALVSQYYSFGGRHISHELPTKNADQFVARAKDTAHLDLDAYVLTNAKDYRSKLERYRDALPAMNVLLRRYEDIYFDKARFLADIFRHFRLEVPDGLVERVARQLDVRPSSERVGHHIRKGSPGDHREKLQPQTIERLNAIFENVCRGLGYTLDNPQKVAGH